MIPANHFLANLATLDPAGAGALISNARAPALLASAYLAVAGEVEQAEPEDLNGAGEELARLSAASFAHNGELLADAKYRLGRVVSGLPAASWHAIVASAGWQRATSRFADSAVAMLGRVEELRLAGVTNPKSVAEVEAEMGFTLDLNHSAIQSRAEELGRQFYEVTLPIPDAYHRLSPSHQEALVKIGRALKLLDLPHRLQASPHAAVFERLVMETPALEPLRPYYLRFAGVYDFLNTDDQGLNHSILPGMEHVTRYPGGGFYPPGTTLEEFRRFIPEGSQADKDMRLMFRYDREGKLQGIPYSEFFARWLKPAADLLDEAAPLLEGEMPAQAGYLRTVAKAFRDNSFPDTDSAWLKLEGSPIDASIGAIEQYLDKVRGYLAQFTGSLQLKDAERERELAVLKEAYPQFEDHLPVPDEFKRPPADRKAPPVFVVDTLYSSADMDSGEVIAIAYNRPNGPQMRDDEGFRIVLIANHQKARDFENPASPRIAALLLTPDQQGFVDLQALGLFIFFHEEAHGNGPEYVIGHPEKKALKELGDIAWPLEELRADIVGLHNAKTAFELGLLTPETLEKIYVSAILDWVVILRSRGLTEAHAWGHLVALNFLLENGAITMDPETGGTLIHLDKMPEGIATLANRIQTLKGTGDKAGAKAFFEKYGTGLPPGLVSIFRQVEDLPRNFILDYAFEELL